MSTVQHPSTPGKSAGANGHARAPVAEAWATHAGALAAGAVGAGGGAPPAAPLGGGGKKGLATRRAAYGGYSRRGGATLQTTRRVADQPPPLTAQALARHFRARTTDAVIGLHSTFCDD